MSTVAGTDQEPKKASEEPHQSASELCLTHVLGVRDGSLESQCVSVVGMMTEDRDNGDWLTVSEDGNHIR